MDCCAQYIVNFIISEPKEVLLILQDKMYKEASNLFANDLYDELISSKIINSTSIICRQTDMPISLTENSNTDRNFVLWSLIPYIAACSGEHLIDDEISFEEVSTIRPDGGNNIINATVISENLRLPDDYLHMKKWCGPMWNEQNGVTLWQINSEWSSRKLENGYQYALDANHALTLYNRDELSKEDWLWLCEHGYAKTNGDFDGNFKASWQIVIFANDDIRRDLISIGTRIKEKYKQKFDEIKKPYIEQMLKSVPTHLRKTKAFELQSIFCYDGWFLLHCYHTLLENGKLKIPTENQRKSLSTLIIEK